MMDRIAIFIALGFGSGLVKPAPGTWGSLTACVIAYGIIYAFGFMGLFIAAGLASILGIWAASRYSAVTQTSDASEVVIDEFAGQWIALGPVAVLAPNNILAWVAAFALFRALDILKPGPIGMLDKRLKGGLGIMMDDLLAGVIAAFIMQLGLTYVVF